MRTFRAPSRVAAIVLFTACIPLPGGNALASLPVAAKEGDSTLVADDGSRCAVTATTFARIRIGDAHTCVWREPGDGTRRTGERPAEPGRGGMDAPTPTIALPTPRPRPPR